MARPSPERPCRQIGTKLAKANNTAIIANTSAAAKVASAGTDSSSPERSDDDRQHRHRQREQRAAAPTRSPDVTSAQELADAA